MSDIIVGRGCMGKLTKALGKLSNEQLLCLEKVVPRKFRDVFEEVRLKKYIQEIDLENINLYNRSLCLINRGVWDYPLFQVSFLSNMLANIVDCMSKGYLPVVDFRESKADINLWEQFLVQPYGHVHEICNDNTANVEYDKERALLYFPVFPTDEDVRVFSKLIKKFVVLNESTQRYMENEYEFIIKGKRVLGILCRGTDYVSNKPEGHPVQPEIKDMIEFVREKMTEQGYDYIYLATEEKNILDQFQEAFPNKILTNKRFYYDDFYNIKEEVGDGARISQVHNDRENDNYYKSLEYLSSLFLLSRCDALIAGNCGGSRLALYLNDNKYKYWYLFNLGVY